MSSDDLRRFAPGPETVTALRLRLRYRSDGVTVLTVQGAIDRATADVLEHAMIAAVQGHRGRTAVLDLREVSAIAPIGLQALTRAYRHAEDRDVQWRLCELRPVVARTLTYAGLLRIFPVYPSLEEALLA